MKYKYYALLITTLLVLDLSAQTAKPFNFQAVIRNLDGDLVVNSNINIKLAIVSDNENGTIIYQENHSVTTNSNGLLTLLIGQGQTELGDFSNIPWQNGIFYLKRYFDIDLDNTYDIVGISQILPVPFAIYAEVADSVIEKQSLYLSNDTIFLSKGGYVKLPSALTETQMATYLQNNGYLTTEIDGDPSNEIQSLSKIDRTISLSLNGGSFTDSVLTEQQVDAYVANNGYLTTEIDGDLSNEIQSLSKSDRTIFLSLNGGSFTDSVLTEQQVDAYVANNGYLTTEIDGDPSNEIQSLSVSAIGDTLFLSQGNFVIIPGISISNSCGGIEAVDIDGNKYPIIKLGNQCWFAENLKTTRFNDGAPITNITDADSWSNTSQPAFSFYNNDYEKYKDYYGIIYNGYAVENTKLCPIGWHIPNLSEIETLISNVGGSTIAGSRLKSLKFGDWFNINNIDSNNSSNFLALPGGRRQLDGTFDKGGYISGAELYMWLSTLSGDDLRYLLIYDNFKGVDIYGLSKKTGMYVRCLKD